jgi:hypothetical protein
MVKHSQIRDVAGEINGLDRHEVDVEAGASTKVLNQFMPVFRFDHLNPFVSQ